MSHIASSLHAGLLEIRFDRPERKNSITASMYTRLTQLLLAAEDDNEVRAVLFEGGDNIFSAGNDLEEFLNSPPLDPMSPAYEFIRALARFPKPVVATVRGAAVGVGATMMFHCELVYAAENAVFSLPFIDLGLCPEAGSALLAPQMLGYHKAAEALLLGDPIDAQSALSLGLINKVLPSSDVAAFGRAQAQRLASKPLSSLLQSKRLMRAHQQAVLETQMQEEVQTFIDLLSGPAAREAFTAFSQKRKPDFSTL